MRLLAICATFATLVSGCAQAPLPDVPSVSTAALRAGVATPAGSAWQYGQASYYAEGALTASGERFNPDGLTAAHRTLKFGTRIRVCRVSGVRACVEVRVNDRGPFVAGRVLDLSRGAMRAIGGISAGVVSVRWAVVG